MSQASPGKYCHNTVNRPRIQEAASNDPQSSVKIQVIRLREYSVETISSDSRQMIPFRTLVGQSAL